MDTDYGKKIVKNTFFVASGYIFGVAASFVITPYIIYKLGLLRFGIWSLINILFEYCGLLDMGINFSFIRFISQYYSRKEYQAINHLLSTGICFNIIFGLLIFMLVIFTRRIFLFIFGVEVALMAEINRTLFVVGALYLAKAPFRIFSSLIDGLQRFKISRAISMATVIISTVSAIIALELGCKLDGLVLISGATYFLTIFVTLFMSLKIYPEMDINLFRFDRGIFKELFSFGINVQMAQLARTIHFEVDKLIIGIFLNPIFVGFYELGAKIDRVLKMIPTFALFAVLPASSEMHALGKKRELLSLYNYGSKFMAIINIFLSVTVFILAPQIIYMWLGAGFDMSILVVRTLIFAYSVSMMISAFGVEIARGMGMVTYERKASFYQAGLNIILSIGLVYPYGFKGVLWGTVISSLVGSFYFLVMFHRDIFPYDLTSLFKNIYQTPLYAGTLAGIFVVISNRYALSCFGSLNRISAAVYVLSVGILSFCVFSFTILQSKYFSRMELARILYSISPWGKLNARIITLIYGE